MSAVAEVFIAVVDLETTGFEASDGHMPVEIGRADLIAGRDLLGFPDWHAAAIRGPASALVDPGRAIPPEASAIHHLVDEDVRGEWTWPETVAAFVKTHGPRPLAFAAHSAKMERQWLTEEIVGDVPWLCTWKCALRAFPEAPGHSNQCLRYWLAAQGLPGRLDCDLAAPAHRAGPDAYVTAFLLRELLERHPLEELLQWSAEPALLVRVPFGKPPPEGSRGLKWSEVADGLLYWTAERDFSEEILHTVRVEIARREAAAEAEHEDGP